MHFREVNNKLKQLKSNVQTTFESMQNEDWNNTPAHILVKNHKEAQQELETFRNTTIGQLS
ncbi:hypothetical protein TaPaz_08 [Acinetobacter phage TaPaz]|nr:hypothetical protein TaPaz_08 [Acinetobacter phage TaPaz]